ncbi:hypothetical protein [Paenarthrobacter nitroguajacolicus]|uniref:hypothetical protein n=1 Tax=Paenarthrobacter nitroguajacolicus TaxID=211146 RepID=UPI00286D522C|nr:hypothetical protein [Paenarthrobacter nitroguajacolicus]
MSRSRYFPLTMAAVLVSMTGCTGGTDRAGRDPVPEVSESVLPSAAQSPDASDLGGLERIPWDGGPAFYKKFTKADAAGWDDPAFFPIGVWYASANDPQMKFDKAHGINFYVQSNPDVDYKVFDDNGMFSLMKVKNAPENWAQLPGNYVDDEVDGRFEWDAGITHMTQTIAGLRSVEEGRFTYANWTPSLISYDAPMEITKRYWDTVDVSSTSNYYYASACRDWRLRTPSGYSPTTTATCQSSSAYAKAMQVMQEVNTARGVQSPIWMLPTVLSPEGESDLADQMTPERVKAQVWAMLIHDSRGIVWFTQAPGGGADNPCMSGDALADVRISNRDCAREQVQAMAEINAQVKALAPVLNTQSYVWDFGSGLDTMLKTHDGSAYVFAMTEDAQTGQRILTLPPGIRGRTVEVLDENRSLPVVDGKFVDDFPQESTHHVYKVAL